LEKIMIVQCPDDEMLVDFLENRLTKAHRQRVESHLVDCDSCLESLLIAQTEDVHDNTSSYQSVPPSATQAAMRLVHESGGTGLGEFMIHARKRAEGIYRRVADALTPVVGEPATVPIRGTKHILSDDLIKIQKTFKEIVTEIEIEKVSPRRAHIRVRLIDGRKDKNGIRVTLKRQRRVVASFLLAGGYVVFEDTLFGRYTLDFSFNGNLIGTYPFEIRGTSNG
jgi:hypothetical protein